MGTLTLRQKSISFLTSRRATSWGVVMIIAPSRPWPPDKYWTIDKCSSEVPGGVSNKRKLKNKRRSRASFYCLLYHILQSFHGFFILCLVPYFWGFFACSDNSTLCICSIFRCLGFVAFSESPNNKLILKLRCNNVLKKAVHILIQSPSSYMYLSNLSQKAFEGSFCSFDLQS